MPDHQTLLVRRGVALAAALILLILIVIGISSCERSARRNSLISYNHSLSSIGQDSDTSIGQPLFRALQGAHSQPADNVQLNINQLRIQADGEVSRAKGLSVPGAMAGAQRDLLLTLDLRSEALAQIANQIAGAIAPGSAAQASADSAIAGADEELLASDVVYAQRVAPLAQQALADDGVHDQTTAPSRFVKDLGWLDATTVASRLGGQSSTASTGPIAPGLHGHSLGGVVVGSTTLSPSPAVNRIPGGATPTFTVMVTNAGTNEERSVKVDVTVSAAGVGKTVRAQKTIDRTEPGTTTNVDIPVTGVPLNVPATVTIVIEAVPGEKNLANNRGTFTAEFTP